MAKGSASLAASLSAAGFRGETLIDEPLARYTTWRMGGPADLLVSPVDREDLATAVAWAGQRGLPWRVLGNGSNLLVRERGVRGLVIRLRRVLDGLTWREPRVVAGAGAMLPALANRAADRGLAGLEFAAGIPGTIGGAIVMNAGWHEFEIGRFVRDVEVLDPEGGFSMWPRDRCEFAYRGSALRRERGAVVLAATLELAPGDAGEVRSRLETFAESRKRNQPTELPSCGSVFLKPPGDFAGRLIEEAGLKGLRVGDIEVSPLHANFFVNVGRGRADDVLTLVQRVEEEVLRRFGVSLEREFELW